MQDRPGDALGDGERRGYDEKTTDALSRHRRERSVEILDGSRGNHEEFRTELLAGSLHRLQGGSMGGRRGFQRMPTRIAAYRSLKISILRRLERVATHQRRRRLF